MYSVNASGTLPESIAAFTDITDFSVNKNAIEGPLPSTTTAWTKLVALDVGANKFTGALPSLPFETMSGCFLLGISTPYANAFDCPWPAGAVAKCSKYIGDSGGHLISAPITNYDCQNTCTGSSVNLSQPQCDAWVNFYDALGGPGWKVTDPSSPKHNQPVCSDARTDPCSCQNNYGSPTSVCNDAGTAVTRM